MSINGLNHIYFYKFVLYLPSILGIFAISMLIALYALPMLSLQITLMSQSDFD